MKRKLNTEARRHGGKENKRVFSVPPCLRVELVFWFALLCVLCGQSFALDRSAFVFARYDLEVRVDPAGQAIAARGKILLRNVSSQPQRDASLQISSSLEWRMIQYKGKDLQFVADSYTSDIDHTGALNEAVVTLPYAVPPQGTIELEAGYDGTIARDATRLTRVGTPEAQALHSDWDQIKEPITVVRGAGYVTWYPVAMPAANLSEGTVFSELSAWKESQSASEMKVNFCWVSESDQVAVVANGRLGNVSRQTLDSNEDTTTHAGCSSYQFSHLDTTVPTFAIAEFATLGRPAINVYHLAADNAGAQEYALDAEKVAPFVAGWFGEPREKVAVIELPEKGDAPFESGPMLFTPLTGEHAQIEVRMAHQLEHASFRSPRRWIDEGLAHFAEALWREQEAGRNSAIVYMDGFMAPLQAADPTPFSSSSSSSSSSQTTAPAQARNNKSEITDSLINSGDEILYRIKAMFVWWMLRDMVGDDILRKAISEYQPIQDTRTSYMPGLIQRQTKRDLSWFFDDWVYRDRGLPDFRISAAFPRATLAGSTVVTVTVENAGDAAAEVPVRALVSQGEQSVRVLVPAHGKEIARIQIAGTPTEAIVNDGSVPESDTKNNSMKLETPPKEPR